MSTSRNYEANMFSDVGAVYANHHTVHSEIVVGIELRLSQIYERAFRDYALLTVGENATQSPDPDI
jgi:hypothetical protein